MLMRVIGVASFSSQCLDLAAGFLDVRDPDVEMEAILDPLRLGNALKGHPWHTRRHGGKRHELRRFTKPSLNFDSEDRSPKSSQTFRFIRVGLYPSELADSVLTWHGTTIDRLFAGPGQR